MYVSCVMVVVNDFPPLRQKLYASRNDHVGRSPSQTAAGLQSEAGHQFVGQCCQLHVPRHWIAGEDVTSDSTKGSDQHWAGAVVVGGGRDW